MLELVYILCGVTSSVCSYLLLRSYNVSHHRILLWSGLCFLGLAMNNFLLFADYVSGPDMNLSPVRQFFGFAALLTLIGGFIWETT